MIAVALSGAGLQIGQSRILHPLRLQIEAGECVAIIGPSGAGKTSLLRLLGTELRGEGKLALWGQDPWALSTRTRQRLRSRIGMVWQQPPLPTSQPVMTAVLAGRLGQWSLGRALLSLLRPCDPEGARAELARLGLADKWQQHCGELSGGQLQRVGIARVLDQNPESDLPDEPSLGPGSRCWPKPAYSPCNNTSRRTRQYADHQSSCGGSACATSRAS
ncbi:ATP-binding cassette domain-containing protein [Aeromonas sp. A-5]|uniref:ATP-binding cassette domain-containing protein n=1 Tax=Aeromonas ichthyocola TaxID=3367746 RepID=UPI0038E96FC2